MLDRFTVAPSLDVKRPRSRGAEIALAMQAPLCDNPWPIPLLTLTRSKHCRMPVRTPRIFVVFSALTFLWLSGCASAPKKPVPMDESSKPAGTLSPESDAETLPPSLTASSNAVPAVVRTTVTDSAVPLSPKPWQVVLEHGSRRAVVDGVVLWMGNPAKQGTDKKVRAAPADERASLDPLLNANGQVFVRGRPMRVMLDPGHGGEDPGALSRDRQQRESAHVLDIARRLSTYLTRAGYEVRMTRTDDATFVPLEDRPAMAAAWPADVFVSIHLNSASNGSADGLETFVLPPPGMRATSQVDLPTIPPAVQATLRKAYPGNAQDDDNLRLAFCIHRRMLKTTGFADRGLRRARFMVLRDATMPAILVEAGFLSNRKDAEFIGTPNGRERVARGIYQGIIDFNLGQIAPGHSPAAVVPARIVAP